MAVVVQIDGNDVDAAVPRVDDVGDELWLRVVGGFVLQDRDVSGRVVAECGNRKVGLAVLVEIAGFDVGDARPAIQPHRAELAVPYPAQPDHGAVVVIERGEFSEVSDQQVLDAIFVEIDGRDVVGMRDAGQHGEIARGADVRRIQQDALLHLGGKRIDLRIAVEVRQPDVRNRRSAGDRVGRECVHGELDR
jgi:hypothetical protein